MEDCRWPNVKSDIKRPTEYKRGCFYLHVPPEECAQVWKRIGKLTAKGRLGYMSSISPEITFAGDWAGNNLICVHTIHVERKIVLATLERAGLASAEEYGCEYDRRIYDNKWSAAEGNWVTRGDNGNE